MNRKLSINVFLNILKTILSLIFPLITFPYISRIFGVENIGKLNFASSFVGYFILLSEFGISVYGMRECAKRKDDKKEFSNFASQLFSVNILTAFFSCFILLILIFFVPSFYDCRLLLLIYSLQIVFNTIGTDWINIALEDFKYITIRYIIFQLFSLILLFMFIHSGKDYILYAVLSVFASSGANIANYFHVRKFCSIRFTLNISFNFFIRPLFHIFVASIASAIYTNIDITMLRFIDGDYSVGIYSCALKIYKFLKQVIIALFFAFEPRLSYEFSNDKQEYLKILNEVFGLVITLVVPLTIGVIIISKNIILIFSGIEFLNSSIILDILSASLLPCSISYVLMHGIMLPSGCEKDVEIPTVIGAISNIILNLVLIPKFSTFGGTIATLFSEFLVMISCVILTYNHKFLKFRLFSFIKILIGCFLIIIVGMMCKYIQNIYLNIIVTIFSNIFIYFFVEILLKNEYVYKYYIYFKSFFKKAGIFND